MKSILVTGAFGQMGREIKYLSDKYPEFEYIFTDIDQLDITNSTSLECYFKENKINYVINCAAYTAVDKAESEPDIAALINTEAVLNLVRMCNKYKSTLFQFSTDYVFNSSHFSPYLEDHIRNPLSVYGNTKLNAENIILDKLNTGVILRISWLYSSFGNNFVKTMLKLGAEKPQLSIVSDQIGSPSYARDVVKGLFIIIDQMEKGIYQPLKPEIFHYSGEGFCSWYDFAKEIMKLSKIKCKINDIESKDYPTAAKRPTYSVLNKLKIKETFGINIPHWKESLKECLVELGIRNITKRAN